MKRVRASAPATVGMTAVAVLMTLVAGTARAQDAVKAAPKNFKVLLDNERVRVLDFHSAAGEKIAMHSHPAYISYSLSGSGKTKFTSADGKTTEQPNKPEAATWHEPDTHASEYLGPGATHVLLIELKGGGR